MASYKDLKKFKNIIDRNDFSFISDERNIEAVSQIIQSKINFPDGTEQNSQEIVTEFLINFRAFYQWIDCKKILALNEGYNAIETELVRALNLLREPEEKRKAISKGYVRKFRDNFLNGYRVFVIGIRTLFDSEYTASTGLQREQLVKYILNNVEGLGKKYEFNTRGNNAFANKLPALTRQELLVVLRLLLDPIPSQTQTTRLGWLKLGVGKTPIKIIGMAPRLLRRQRIYYVFKISEHQMYEAQLDTPPDRCAFQSAA